MDPEAEEEQELYRRAATGAFSHELRTPLTSAMMVIELARRDGAGDTLVLDSELAGMLRASVEHLQQLADDLQEASRLERGKVALSRGPCDLTAAVAAARDLLGTRIQLRADVPPLEGPWDAPRLVRALAGFAEGANRAGDGSGEVTLQARERGTSLLLAITSGAPGGPPVSIGADVGFAFFRSRLFVLALGGQVACERAERFIQISATLPLG